MNVSEISYILMDVRPGLSEQGHFRLGLDDSQVYLQYVDPAIGPEANGRKWRISEFATKSEIVQTAFMAVMAWQEHELRESFRYKGQAIFGPHFDVEALAELAASKAHDVRKEMP